MKRCGTGGENVSDKLKFEERKVVEYVNGCGGVGREGTWEIFFHYVNCLPHTYDFSCKPFQELCHVSMP